MFIDIITMYNYVMLCWKNKCIIIIIVIIIITLVAPMDYWCCVSVCLFVSVCFCVLA